MKTILLLSLLMVLAGCQAGEKLAGCKGPVFALNPGHWLSTKADLKACPQTVEGRQIDVGTK